MRAAAVNSLARVLNLHRGAYILSSTDCFVVSQFFSVARQVGRLKLGSKPAQLYVRLSISVCVCVCAVYIYIYIWK